MPVTTEPTLAIEVNGRRFHRAPRKRAGTPLPPPPAGNGWFKPNAHGVLMMTPEGKPFAYASRNDWGFLVSASLHKERVWYMFGLADRDEAALGITGYIHGRETARAILEQAGVEPRR